VDALSDIHLQSVYGIIEDIPCSTAHLEVHSADLGVKITQEKLIFACNACLYSTVSHCIVAIYYCGDTVHVKLFVVRVISYLSKDISDHSLSIKVRICHSLV